MTELTFKQFHTMAEAAWQRASGAPGARRVLSGELNRSQLALLTLQMYHYVKYTVPVFEYALTLVRPGREHDPLAQMLRFFAHDEAGHDRVALRDLQRMGYAKRCAETLPLPATLNLHGANRLAVEEYGPYYLVGETYATETVGARISRGVEHAYRDVAEVSFYAVHAEADPGHAAVSERVVRHALSMPGNSRAITLGYLTALHNLQALAEAVLHAEHYPAAFQLP